MKNYLNYWLSQVDHTRLCLIKIGTHIDAILATMKEDEAREWRRYLFCICQYHTLETWELNQ